MKVTVCLAASALIIGGAAAADSRNLRARDSKEHRATQSTESSTVHNPWAFLPETEARINTALGEAGIFVAERNEIVSSNQTTESKAHRATQSAESSTVPNPWAFLPETEARINTALGEAGILAVERNETVSSNQTVDPKAHRATQSAESSTVPNPWAFLPETEARINTALGEAGIFAVERNKTVSSNQTVDPKAHRATQSTESSTVPNPWAFLPETEARINTALGEAGIFAAERNETAIISSANQTVGGN